jgi:hypothetical protein
MIVNSDLVLYNKLLQHTEPQLPYHIHLNGNKIVIHHNQGVRELLLRPTVAWDRVGRPMTHEQFMVGLHSWCETQAANSVINFIVWN